jgi:metal-responsive CopG/Arc/MetJ family transcriptional regulator
MSLKNKTKVYLSLDLDLLNFVQERSNTLGVKRARYISDLLQKDFDHYQKEKINKIIEGVNNDN